MARMDNNCLCQTVYANLIGCNEKSPCNSFDFNFHSSSPVVRLVFLSYVQYWMFLYDYLMLVEWSAFAVVSGLLSLQDVVISIKSVNIKTILYVRSQSSAGPGWVSARRYSPQLKQACAAKGLKP